MGVLKYLALFFNHLSEATLLNYLPVLHELVHSTNPFNWRLREILAVQLSALIRLPPRNEIYHTLFSLAMSLLQDPVAVVRRHALQGMVTIVQLLSQLEEDDPKALCPMPIDEEEVHLMPAPECLETVALAINSLALFTTCYHRQLWLQLAHQLLIHVPRPVFEKYFLEGILRLTTDPVANVRIALSELLTGWSGDFCPGKKSSNGIDSPWSWLLQRKDIRECVIRLSKDVKDVYNNMNKLQAFFPDVVFESIVYTGIKIPPGGAQPVQLQMSKSSLRARYFSWSAVQSHFDVLLASNIITPLTSSNSIAELDAGEESDITTAGNGSRATGRAQKPKVNPTSIAMAFVRGIREKMLTRRNSFREELVNNMEQLVHHNQTLEVDPEIEEGEILLAKVLSKEITHSVLPASINASPGSNNIPLEVVNRAPSL